MPQLPHRKFCLAFKRQTKLKIKVIRKEKFAHRIWSKHEKQLFCGRNSLEREKTAAVVLTSNQKKTKKYKCTSASPAVESARGRETWSWVWFGLDVLGGLRVRARARVSMIGDRNLGPGGKKKRKVW